MLLSRSILRCSDHAADYELAAANHDVERDLTSSKISCARRQCHDGKNEFWDEHEQYIRQKEREAAKDLSMKLLINWSGRRAKLSQMLFATGSRQSSMTFNRGVSDEDIAKGANWPKDLQQGAP